MAKLRVHELAKELGQPSKVVLQKLQDMGEFVRSASSTVEAPVARRLRAEFAPAGNQNQKQTVPAGTTESAPKPAPAATPHPGPRAPAPEARPSRPERHEGKSAERRSRPQPQGQPQRAKGGAPAPSAHPGPKPGAQSSQAPAPKQGSGPKPGGAPKPGAAPKPGGHKPSSSSHQGDGGAPRPGNNPFATSQGMPRPGQRRGKDSGSGGPRPGNNPFATSQGMPRPGQRPARSGDSQQGGGPRPGGPRPGGPRPNPGMMPGHTTLGQSQSKPGGGRGRGRPGGGRPGGGGGAPAGAGGGFGTHGGGPARGRGGRGGTQGAFGRGGKPARSRKSKRAKRQEYEQMSAPAPGGVNVPHGDGNTAVRLRRGASLNDFAERIDANPAALVTVLFHLGEMATATQSLDEDTFALLGSELGYKIEIVSPEDEERELLEQFDIDLEGELAEETDEDLRPRPPVVTVMGHVDHGKTRLLDAIRHAHVLEGEAGGITQHIGAYQVAVPHEGAERKITFIDTPGHEAFTAMRARGAEVTDIAILVVAADDGVMPQTIEALNHAQAAGVPIVVAVNKIDKPGASPDKIRQQLTEYGLVAEEYGGDTMFVDVSARENLHIDDLLEAVLLTADAALDLRANPDKDARGVAIEANLDKGRGPVATVLVQSGTLHVGDAIVAGTGHGRVRAMLDEYGEAVEAAPPSRPVQVLGLTAVPGAGDTFLVAPDDRTARQIAEKREAAQRAAQLAKSRKRVSLEDFTKALAEGKVETLNLILKGDVAGSVEALEDALLKIDVGDEVDLRVIHRGVGAVTQNDVNLATVDNAIIIGFNVRYAERVEDMAEREGVDVRFYSIIYQATEDIESAMKGMLKPEFEEARLGAAEIREIFRSSKFGNIAGVLVREGTIRRNAKARLLRDGTVVAENLSIDSLRRFKDDATEVREGYEAGVGLGSFNDIKEGDVIETYEMREKPRA